MNSHVHSNRKQSTWTDEKHGHFLNSMEECFVRTMLENNHRYYLRLDRQLPDSSESTLDCKHINVHTRKKHASSVDCIGTTRSKMKVRSDKRPRRPPAESQPHDSSSSQDQVVPQIENRDTR